MTQTHGYGISEKLCYMTRTWLFYMHKERLKQLGLWKNQIVQIVFIQLCFYLPTDLVLVQLGCMFVNFIFANGIVLVIGLFMFGIYTVTEYCSIVDGTNQPFSVQNISFDRYTEIKNKNKNKALLI